MNAKIKHIPIFTILLLFAACRSGKGDRMLLARADSLMSCQPDSALHILQNISNPEEMVRADRAEYALLLTQAKDKNYITHTSDSLIRIAVGYYDIGAENELAAKSLFYLGRVYQDMGDEIRAIDAYLHAIRVLPDNADKRFQMLLYNNLADCSEHQEYYDLAMKMFRKSYAVTVKRKEKKELFFSLRGIGGIFMFQDRIDSALCYYQKALVIAQNADDSLWTSAVLCDISRVYYNKKECQEAYQYVSASIKMAPNNKDLYPKYFLKGDILVHLEQPDSARYYLNLCRFSSDIYTKAASSTALYDLEKKYGNYKKAVEYNDTFFVHYDSIQNMKHSAIMNDLLHNHALELHKKELSVKQQKNITLIISVSVSVLILSILWFFLADRHKKTKILALQQELMHNRSSIRLLKEKIKQIHTTETGISNNQIVHEILFELQKQKLELCVRLFKTSDFYKNLLSVEKVKIKKEKKLLVDPKSLREYINNMFADPMQDLRDNCSELTSDDLYYSILYYLGFSDSTIFLCMEIESQQAITQRKYRIKKKMNDQLFSWIFSSHTV